MKRAINYYFLAAVIVLMFSGMLFLATLSAPASMQYFGNTNYYIFHQLIALGIGLIAGFVFYKIPLHILKKLSLAFLIISLLVLVAVFIPFIGTKFWGAKRWISVGNNTFQPSEFLKITAVLYLSAWLSSKFSESGRKGFLILAKKGYYNFIKVFVPFLILLAIITVIFYFQRDVSTLVIISVTLVAIYFAAGTPIWHAILLILSGAGGLLVLIKIEPYRVQRFLTFLHPEKDPLGTGLQLKQSLISLGSGGIFGNGLGMSTQKFGFLPQAMGDSIFAIVGEELGIVGCAVLVFLFLFFLWQGIKIASASTDKFSKLTAVGITTWIAFQAFFNIGSTLGLLPLSGIPLPFFSYGGSHIIAELMGVGILLNISKNG